MNLEELSDKELFDEVQKAGIANKLENSQEWKLLKEAGNRIVERAINEFAKNTRADDEIKIIELQTIIRKYRYGIFNEVELLKQESDLLYAEAESRGLFGAISEWIKS